DVVAWDRPPPQRPDDLDRTRPHYEPRRPEPERDPHIDSSQQRGRDEQHPVAEQRDREEQRRQDEQRQREQPDQEVHARQGERHHEDGSARHTIAKLTGNAAEAFHCGFFASHASSTRPSSISSSDQPAACAALTWSLKRWT